MPRSSRSFPPQPVIPPGGERVEPALEVEAILAELYAHPSIGPCLVHRRDLPARSARFADWPAGISERLVEAFKSRGIENPFSHQAAAAEAALSGRSVVVVTPTASGKSLSYNLPVLQRILERPESRALYLFPTKALSHDQYRDLYEVTSRASDDLKIFTYDGDTPPDTRRALRDAGHIVVSNPDMLHSGILPHHPSWIRLFENLEFVVIDELHHYRGVFGSHFAQVIARLKRLCHFYGSKPVFLCSSATIANPAKHAEELLGEPVTLINESGAPSGAKTFLFYNPPVINKELNVRRSVRLEARKLALRFLTRRHQTIVFARSRTDVEVIATYLRRGMSRAHHDPQVITGYRGGYLPTERREIEHGLKSGKLLGVVSTNALELGVDIGGLDVSIMAGYPGTISSSWQQAGRAGRKGRHSVAIYIGGNSPLDQYLMNHPDYFFSTPPEEALINSGNLPILAAHLRCAAFEMPFVDGEQLGQQDPSALLQHLEDEQVVRHVGQKWFYSSGVYPAEDISLRSAAGENFIVHDSGRKNLVIAEVDYDSAPFLLHDDAVYIHNGKTYLVEKLDWDRRMAYVRHKVLDYYTDAESSSNVQVLHVDHVEELSGTPLLTICRGDVNVSTTVNKFKKVKFESQESIGYGPVTLPPLVVQTEGCWLTFSEDLHDRLGLDRKQCGPVLKAVAGLLRHVIPLYVLCDSRDLGIFATVRSPFDNKPAIYLWDRYPGGTGISRRFAENWRVVMESAEQLVAECPCASGCPSCIGPQLEADGAVKEAAQALLATINQRSEA